MCLNFGGLDIGMPHELLNHADIDPIFEHMGEPALRGGINCTMAEGMAADTRSGDNACPAGLVP